MLFNSLLFVVFFVTVLAILFFEGLISKSIILRNITLLAASYIFYANFNIGFTLILLFVTSVNYIGGNLLSRNRNITRKKYIVAISAVLSLLPLCFFKYSVFLCRSLSAFLDYEINMELLEGLVLPVGISFFTFQALSYTIDIYRGKIEKPASPLDFFLFVAFFPTLLSGPIEKARNLLPQLKKYSFPSLENITQGICVFIWGLFKKIVVADRLAYYVDWAYESAQYRSGITLAVAACFYSIQIYCDFSGYSDMALGVAKALGFDITKNFRQPYFSRTFKEFWRKWHIALTSWFTEYVYFSLGGSRVKYKLCWVFNISTIFLLSGIWHGAAWSFVIWGALHAVFYLTEHFLGLQSGKIRWNRISSLASGVSVFLFVTIAWIFFRLDFNHAIYVIERIFTAGDSFSMGASSFTFVSTLFMLVIFVVYEILVRKKIVWFDAVDFESRLVSNIFAVVPLLILIGMFGMAGAGFVYFQF